MIERQEEAIITVIIPVYNVEEYLNECVESVVNQTFTNLEIILVDDGSFDRCGQICDEWGIKDKRIRVVHQKNGGLSAARNTGLAIAHGEYITFLDSDDYLSLDAIELMYETLIENQAQISSIGYQSFVDKIEIQDKKLPEKLYVWNKMETLDSFLFTGYLTPCACGKLYVRSLWETLRFPEGKLFEDQFTMYKCIDQCEKTVFSPEGRYHYRKRSGSIGHSSFSKRTYDLYEAVREEYNYISKKYATECKNITVARITWEIVFINMMINSDYIDQDILRRVQKFARVNIKKVFNCPYLPWIRKGQIVLFAFFYPIYVNLYRKYKKKHPLS